MVGETYAALERFVAAMIKSTRECEAGNDFTINYLRIRTQILRLRGKYSSYERFIEEQYLMLEGKF